MSAVDFAARGLALRNRSEFASATENLGASLVGFAQKGQGAVGRTLADKAREAISLADFGGGPGADAATNNAAFARALDELATRGGGTLRLGPGRHEIDVPIRCRDNVEIVGSGPATVIANVRAAYHYTWSAVFLPGNFHPDNTTRFYGHASTRPVIAASAGASSFTLEEAGAGSGFAVGDTVWLFTSSCFTNAVGSKIPEYALLAKVLSVTGDVVTLNRATERDFTGNIHNVSRSPVTISLTGDRIAAWCNGRIAKLSVETQGYWIGDSATLDVVFEDVHVRRSRSAVFGNTYQRTRFYNITGRYARVAAEFSHNCDDVIVDGFALEWDPTLGAATGVSYGMSMQENSRGVRVLNGVLNVGGFTGSQSALRTVNAENCAFENVVVRGAPAGSSAVAILAGDPSAGPGRLRPRNNVWRKIDWAGPHSRALYLYDAGADVVEDNLFEACSFSGPCSSNEAVRIDGNTRRNTFRAISCGAGRLVLSSGVRNQNLDNCHIAGGAALLVAADTTLWRENRICGLTGATMSDRRRLNYSAPLAITHTGTQNETVLVDLAGGTDTLALLDELKIRLRAFTNATGAKSVRVKLHNGSTDIDLHTWALGSASATGWLTLTIAYVSSSNLVVSGIAQVGGAATYIDKAITSGIAGNPLSLRISAELADPAGSIQLREATVRLRNPLGLG